MKQFFIFFLIVFMSMIGTKAYAHDIAVENTDGVVIFYNYINDGTELEVTYYYTNSNSNKIHYSDNLVIPEEVTYMNRTRKVTRIGTLAFSDCSGLTSVTIPNSVKVIGTNAFRNCSGLPSVTIPNSVKSIGIGAFYGCSGLTSITIPNGVTYIYNETFSYCSGLLSVSIPNGVRDIGASAFTHCSALTSITIPNSVEFISKQTFSYCSGLTSVFIGNSVKYISESAFENCSSLTSVTIPSSVTSILQSAFENCSSLTSVTISNSVTKIGEKAFYNCSGLTSVTIGNSVTSIGDRAFYGCDIPVINSLIENPFSIKGKNYYGCFSQNTLKNATLFVPIGTIDKYKATDGWNDFLFIQEGSGEGTTPERCEKPTISYNNGKLTFTSGTEGTICQYNITDTDVKAGSGNEVQLTVSYNISVYATKDGYENSETVTATLCWIDVDPKTEGIENSIANIRANPVLIQSNEGVLNISGINDGTDVVVYSVSGQMIGTSKAKGNQASIFTNIQKGEIAIVKIGDKSVKVVMQ